MSDEEEENQEINTKSKSFWLWIGVFGIAALIWFLFGGKWGTTVFDSAHFDAALLILVVFVGTETMVWFRHRTPKLIYDGGTSHTTFFINDLRKVGFWGIARKGGTMTSGIYWPGGEGTIIAPYDSFNSRGNCIDCTAKVNYVKEEQLPSPVRKFLRDNKYPLPVEFGIFSGRQLREPNMAKMSTEMLQQNEVISLFEKNFGKVMDHQEDMLEWAKRITNNKSVADKIEDMFIEKNKSEPK